jgi:dTDP-4-amino-4,6-dideoxygalactose transaminase
MDPIMALAKKHNLKVLEDCSQAHGAKYKGRSVGSIGDVAAWSFCQDKIMTTGGEGGMMTTNDPQLFEFAWSYKDHGKSWDAVYKQNHAPGFRWLHDNWGTNWRMTEIQAAIGRIQINKMSKWSKLRQQNAKAILSVGEQFKNLLLAPHPPAEIEHGWYKCYLFIRPEALTKSWSRDRVKEEIISRGVPCYSGSCPEVYLEKVFEGTGFRPKKRLPTAKKLGETSLMFPVHPTLLKKEISLFCSVISEVLTEASK